MGSQAAVRRALDLLAPGDRLRIGAAALLQSASSLLDLAGVLLFGLVALMAAAAATGTTIAGAPATVLEVLGLADAPPERAILTVSVTAALLFILRASLSLFTIWRVNLMLARRCVEVTSRLAARFLDQPITAVQARPSVETATALTRAVTNGLIGMVTMAVSVISEVSLLVVLSVALLLLDPAVTLAALLYFTAVSWALLTLTGGSVARASTEQYVADVSSITAVQDTITTFREMRVTHRIPASVQRLEVQREIASHARARMLVITQIPRYAMEGALILGAVLMAVGLAMTRDLQNSIAVFVVFLTAATRIMPALLRLHAARMGLRAAEAEASAVLRLVDSLPPVSGAGAEVAGAGGGSASSGSAASGAASSGAGGGGSAGSGAGLTTPNPLPAPADLRLDHLTFGYPNRDGLALADVDLHLPAGHSLAVVGLSGAGKSTLADLILGVLPPLAGSVRIAGLPPEDVTREHPGSVAYVPQDVALVHGTVRDNVALGVPAAQVDDARVWEVLGAARIAELVEGLEGLDTAVGERGVRLSGGQRQRIGLARALYTRPVLLVLDEATSALDALTEQDVTETLSGLGSEVTTVTIAHRLSTIRGADIVLYLDAGRPRAIGSFDAVRRAVPEFDRQAVLLGL